MDVINPNGKEPDKPAETPKPYAFRIDVQSKPGWMILEVDLEAISMSRDAIWKFIGFMEDNKSMALAVINDMAMKRETQKRIIVGEQNKNGFNRFINKFRGGK